MEMLLPPEGAGVRDGYFIVRTPVCPAAGKYSYDKARHTWQCSLKDKDDGYPHSDAASSE